MTECVHQLASVMQDYTQSGYGTLGSCPSFEMILKEFFFRGVRPFGVSLLIAGVDDRGPQVSF